jgi:hypothetical protein
VCTWKWAVSECSDENRAAHCAHVGPPTPPSYRMVQVHANGRGTLSNADWPGEPPTATAPPTPPPAAAAAAAAPPRPAAGGGVATAAPPAVTPAALTSTATTPGDGETGTGAAVANSEACSSDISLARPSSSLDDPLRYDGDEKLPPTAAADEADDDDVFDFDLRRDLAEPRRPEPPPLPPVMPLPLPLVPLVPLLRGVVRPAGLALKTSESPPPSEPKSACSSGGLLDDAGEAEESRARLAGLEGVLRPPPPPPPPPPPLPGL